MNKIELISRTLDPVAWDDSKWSTTRSDVTTMHARRQAANAKATEIAKLIADGTLLPDWLVIDRNDGDIESLGIARFDREDGLYRIDFAGGRYDTKEEATGMAVRHLGHPMS
jgi:hypothetical protein